MQAKEVRVIALVILLSGIAFPILLRIDVYGPIDRPDYVRITPFKENKYYEFVGWMKPYYVDGLNLSIKGVYEGKLKTVVDIGDRNEVEIMITGLLNESGRVEFCDNDGICEPCLKGICETAENAFVCGDCQPSSKDGACLLVDDGRCDPDCVLEYYDEDPGCVEYEFSERKWPVWLAVLMLALISVAALVLGFRRSVK